VPTTSLGRFKTIFSGLAGTPGINTMYIDADSTSAESYLDAVGSFWNSLTGFIKQGLVITCKADIEIIDSVTGSVTDIVGGSDQVFAGTNTGNVLPLMTNGLIELKTGAFSRGRQVQGKIYVPYPTENSNDTGGPNADYSGALAGAINDLVGMDGTNGALAVWSRPNAVKGYTGFFENVTAWNVWSKWASLRSRRD
jgi:hypothetical protein